MAITGRSLKKWKHWELRKISCLAAKACTGEGVVMLGADHVWHEELWLWSSSSSLAWRQSQAGGTRQVESLVHKNYRADSLFTRHHTDIWIYFPETGRQPGQKCVWNTENVTTGFVIWKVSKTVLRAGGRCCRPQSLIKQSQPKVYSTKLHTWGQISNNRWAKYKVAQANWIPC